jgi:hypothetical protein
MELQISAATVRDETSLFNDRSLKTTGAAPAPAPDPDIDARAPRLGLDSFARHSRAVGRRWPPERWGTEPAATSGPPLEREKSIQALTVPVELVDRGDVIAIGHRFYRVDGIPQTHPRLEFPLIVLRSLETAAHAAIEFRNSDALVSILRFPTMLMWAGDTALAQGDPLGRSASRFS